MPRKQKEIPQATALLVPVIAWLIPGAGHWYLGRKKRGAIICAAICATFLIGLVLGSVELINPKDDQWWFIAEVFSGLPALVTALIPDPTPGTDFIANRGVSLGQVYAGVAGLLNLVCVLDALMLASQPVRDNQK